MASDKQDSAGTTCGSHHLNFRFSKVQRWEVKPGLPHRIRGIHRRHRHSFRYESVPINHNPCVNVTFSEVTGCTAFSHNVATHSPNRSTLLSFLSSLTFFFLGFSPAAHGNFFVVSMWFLGHRWYTNNKRPCKRVLSLEYSVQPVVIH